MWTRTNDNFYLVFYVGSKCYKVTARIQGNLLKIVYSWKQQLDTRKINGDLNSALNMVVTRCQMSFPNAYDSLERTKDYVSNQEAALAG